MAIWKDTPSKKDATPAAPAVLEPPAAPRREADRLDSPLSPPSDMSAEFSAGISAPRRATPAREAKESLIAAELTIEGKIDGAGHVRIAGRFKGDVNVQGDLTIEHGAKLTGSVRANTVIIAGEVEGNIDDAQRVELLESGVLTGNLKAGVLTVAAGSRMRGQVEFGWDEKGGRTTPRIDSSVAH